MFTTFLAVLASSAQAGWVPEFSENWDASNVANYSGTNSWISGYSADPWTTNGVSGVRSLTDDNSGPWGGNSGADNHLVKTDLVFSDFQLDVQFRSNDNDAVGTVFRFQDDSNFYAAFISNGAVPRVPDGSGIGQYFPNAWLYKVEAGVASVLAVTAAGYTQGQYHDSRLTAVGNLFEYYVDLNRNGIYEANELLLSVTDNTWAQGNIGLYSYTNGDPVGTDFDDLVVSIWDQDDDGVADIYDNCPGAFNPLQDNLDGDAFGDACDLDIDGDGFEALADSDCDDLNALVNPGAAEVCNGIDDDCSGVADDNAIDATLWYGDSDNDNFGDPADVALDCNQPPNFVAVAGDCNPTDGAIYPGAPEFCNGVDDDCSGVADDNNPIDGLTWYRDADGDGEGNLVIAAVECLQPIGYVDNADDCDDTDSAVHTLAIEMCDGIDNDCDGVVDEYDAADAVNWYFDGDLDGFGDPYTSLSDCNAPSGFVADNTDCDDEQFLANPGVLEMCDGIDNDCDGLVDEADAIDPGTFYLDADLDGFGDDGNPVVSCDAPSGYVADNTDCDDGNDAIHPDTKEYCATPEDDDCDGQVNEDDSIDAVIWCVDTDGDGFGDCGAGQVTACVPPTGYVGDDTDCNDAEVLINPAAIEQCTGIDENCNGLIDDGVQFVDWYPDLDGDGHGDPAGIPVNDCIAPPATANNDTDCDDNRGDVHLGAPEFCNGIDNDCDGVVDNDALNAEEWYPDLDGDGYGVEADAVTLCDQPTDHTDLIGDCDDDDPAVNPDALEVCNGIDDNCDGAIDEDLPLETWYLDLDGDGFGDPESSVEACAQPSDAVEDDTDCDDTDPAVNPDAEELAGNGVDEDCDGADGLDDDDARQFDPDPIQDDAVKGGPSGCDCQTATGSAGWLPVFVLLWVVAGRRYFATS